MAPISEKTICFTGGGSGGHVIPGLAVIQQLQKIKSYDVFWIGSGKSIEKKLVGEAKIPFKTIPAGKLRRYFSLQNIIDIFKVLAGIITSFFILNKYKPLVLFSKGGYVSVPPVLAARFLKIPVITHESDFDPGLATRLSAGRAAGICVSYAQTAGYFPEALRKRITVTGNPVRQAILEGNPEKGKKITGCPDALPLILVLGGSLGASAVNDLIDAVKNDTKGKVFIVHQRGADKMDPDIIEFPHVFTRAYFDEELPHILSAASFVISRAGANTLWELAAVKKPSILIPLSAAQSRGDQIRNAAFFEKAGAALVLQENTATPKQLLELILKLVDNRKMLTAMSKAAGDLFKKDAALRIAETIIKIADERKIQQ